MFVRDVQDGRGGVVIALAASEADSRHASPPVVLVDEAMQQLYALAERIARGTITVLLLGETGVGKEVLSEALHRLSPRCDKPLVRLNCAALSESLFESELFGYEKGAFTGAAGAKVGLLESANGGTVLLDEIGEMPLPLQAKVLRVIEEHKVWRIGGLQPRPVDVRFIAATNRDLEAEIARGRFRQDLYFRLNGVCLTVPPLRQRRAEIEPLARAFVERACRALGRATPLPLTPAAVRALQEHSWPGNIRELRNVIDRAVLLCHGDAIGVECLPLDRMHGRGGEPEPPPSARTTPDRAAAGDDLRGELDAVERRHILEALDACGGNQTRAAKQLRISRSTLIARLDAYGIKRPRKPR